MITTQQLALFAEDSNALAEDGLQPFGFVLAISGTHHCIAPVFPHSVVLLGEELSVCGPSLTEGDAYANDCTVDGSGASRLLSRTPVLAAGIDFRFTKEKAWAELEAHLSHLPEATLAH